MVSSARRSQISERARETENAKVSISSSDVLADNIGATATALLGQIWKLANWELLPNYLPSAVTVLPSFVVAHSVFCSLPSLLLLAGSVWRSDQTNGGMHCM